MKASVRWMIILSVLMSPVCASAEVHTVTCGSVIDIAAEPFEGYRFVQWADGNTDALRTIEVNNNLYFTAFFTPICRTYEDVPVSAVSHNMYIVQLHKLADKGYYVNPNAVSWYRVVGEIDDPTVLELRDDQLIRSGIGLYLADSPENAGLYYAEVDVAADYSGRYCGDVLRSDILQFTPLETYEMPMVFPTLLEPDQTITVTGLPDGEDVQIYMYDIQGRLVADDISSGGATFVRMHAPTVCGFYLIRIKGKDTSYTLRVLITLK